MFFFYYFWVNVGLFDLSDHETFQNKFNLTLSLAFSFLFMNDGKKNRFCKKEKKTKIKNPGEIFLVSMTLI